MLVDLIIGLNYFLPWDGIRHPPTRHGVMVGSVSPSFPFGLGHVSRLRQWGAGRQERHKQRLEMCLCDWICSLVRVVIAVMETCPDSRVGAKRVRGMCSRTAPGLQLGAEHE